MTTEDRRTRYYDDPRNRDGLCITCKHFYRHYLRWQPRDYRPLDAGHCVQSRRTKNRRAYDTCEHFEQKERN